MIVHFSRQLLRTLLALFALAAVTPVCAMNPEDIGDKSDPAAAAGGPAVGPKKQEVPIEGFLPEIARLETKLSGNEPWSGTVPMAQNNIRYMEDKLKDLSRHDGRLLAIRPKLDALKLQLADIEARHAAAQSQDLGLINARGMKDVEDF